MSIFGLLGYSCFDMEKKLSEYKPYFIKTTKSSAYEEIFYYGLGIKYELNDHFSARF